MYLYDQYADRRLGTWMQFHADHRDPLSEVDEGYCMDAPRVPAGSCKPVEGERRAARTTFLLGVRTYA